MRTRFTGVSRSRAARPILAEALERRALLASIVVTTLADAGAGSLRSAIDGAAPSDTIDLTGLSGAITLESELTIDKSLNFVGPGIDQLSISGNDNVRVFNQSAGAVTVEGITIRDGEAGNGFGGGWRLEGGSATFTRVRFIQNHAGQGGAIAAIAYDGDAVQLQLVESSLVDNSTTTDSFVGAGGAICLFALDGTEDSSPGRLDFVMRRSLVASNTASGPTYALGGGIYARASSGLDGLGGGVLNLDIENSTLANNSATTVGNTAAVTRGGGIYIEARGAEGVAENDSDVSVQLVNNTIARNEAALASVSGSAAEGGGVYLCTNALTSASLDFDASNNIIASNTSGDLTLQLGSAINVLAGHNLVGVLSPANPGITNGTSGNIVGVDAKLGTLADHGGYTNTIDIAYSSPARDAGDDASAPVSDQRGQARVGHCDIGAYEWHNSAPTWPPVSLPSGRVGAASTTSIRANDVDEGQLLTLELIDAPTFVTLDDNGDGSGLLDISPTLADIGSHTFSVIVSDGIATAEISLTLVIRNSLIVSNTDDSGPGSIRRAIADANEGDTVDLTSLRGTIALLSPLLITNELVLLGPGRDLLTISGGGATRLFTLGDETNGGDLTVRNLGLSGGYASVGGAILLTHDSSLQLEDVRVSNSIAVTDGGAIASIDAGNTISLTDCFVDGNTSGARGGGLYVLGGLNLLRSTISDNAVEAMAEVDGESTVSEGLGGGIYLAGGTHSITNSTIASNGITTAEAVRRNAFGGGVFVEDSTLTMTSVTIALNSVDVEGGAAGLYVDDVALPELTLHNALIAANTGEADVYLGAFAQTSVATYNLIGQMAANDLLANNTGHNRVGSIASPIDARLGSLDDYGGSAPTVRLRKGSPAINAGSSEFGDTSDQRGTGRVGLPDIGAFEYVAPPNNAPDWSVSSLGSATTSIPYTLALSASDPDVDDSLSLSLVSGPSFLRLVDRGDGTGVLSGTPTLADVGRHSIQLRVSDGTSTDLFTAELVVSAAMAQIVDRKLYINGTDSADTITALLQNSTTIRVTRGSSTLDFALSQVSRIVVNAFGGNDTIKAQVNRLPTTVYGGDGNDLIRGGGGDDLLYGDAGADYIDTGAGRNRAFGGTGNDTLTGGNSADRLAGDEDDDLVSGRGGPDVLFGNDGNDRLDTGSDRNRANGGAGDDTLIGGNSADRLSGDEGNDLLIGNRGKDYLFGGNGTDRAVTDANDVIDSIETIG